jgi:hypothetical protein
VDTRYDGGKRPQPSITVIAIGRVEVRIGSLNLSRNKVNILNEYRTKINAAKLIENVKREEALGELKYITSRRRT